MLVSRQSPGPGAYNAMEALKRQEGSTNGGRFNMSKPKTFLESVEYATKGIPGLLLYSCTLCAPECVNVYISGVCMRAFC